MSKLNVQTLLIAVVISVGVSYAAIQGKEGPPVNKAYRDSKERAPLSLI